MTRQSTFRTVCLMGALLIVCGSAAAQNQPLPPLVPDRPGFYCGSQALLPGVFHLETGVAVDRFTENNRETDTVAIPMVFRFGLLDGLEVQVSTTGIPSLEQEILDERFNQSGLASPAVGFKWNFSKGGEEFLEPSLGFLFSLNLPVGSRAFRPDQAEPTFNFASDFSIDDRTSLSTNLGVNVPFDSEGDDYFTEIFFAAALGRSLTARSAWFVEIAGSAPQLEGADATVMFDGGVTYLLHNDVQLDVSLTRGLTQAASDWIVAGGISIRFY